MIRVIRKSPSGSCDGLAIKCSCEKNDTTTDLIAVHVMQTGYDNGVIAWKMFSSHGKVRTAEAAA